VQTVDGRVWVWGRLVDRHLEPTLVMEPEDKINQIDCGANYMAAWRGILLSYYYYIIK
jgi:hypothetical protein